MRRPSASWQRWPALLAAAAVVSSLWMGVAEAVSAGDFFVHSLPGAPDGPLLKMHAGHIEVTPEHNGNLFFWHFQNKHIANKQRTLIWLNGGPGCSSEDGALMEVGPYRLKDDHSLEYNEGSWNEFANVMFVDNPVGTGFSYVNTDSYVHELDEMADQFVIFLEKFFDIFPEYMHDDLYFAGESFAGQYIPYIAKHILDRNKKPTTQHPWALKGLLIGNGWIAPREQYEAYLDYAYENKLVEKGSVKSQKLEKQRSACRADLAAANGREPVDLTSCEEILQALLSETRTMSGNDKDCLNMYDVRLRDSYPSCGMNWPPDLPNLRSYLRRDDVIQALHVNPNKNTGWSECNGQVGSQFRPKESLPSITLLPDLLAEVPIALFSGADDLICNHLGTESMIGNMEWNGGKGFELSPGNWAPRREWTFEGKDAGFWQEARNLTYILYYESSHMVPFDHPRRTRDMLDRFMGVDISSIGGTPTDSRIDGERGPATTVGGASGNTTAGQMVEQGEVDAAKWAAYRRSGEIVLVIVAVAASAWGYYVWRERQKRSRAGYRGVASGPLGLLGMSSSSSSDVAVPLQGGSGRAGTGRNRNGSALENFRNKRASRDLEAGDFDEGELDDLHTSTPDARYSVGADSDDDDDDDNDSKASSSKAAAGKTNGASNGTTESNGKGEEK